LQTKQLIASNDAVNDEMQMLYRNDEFLQKNHIILWSMPVL